MNKEREKLVVEMRKNSKAYQDMNKEREKFVVEMREKGKHIRK